MKITTKTTWFSLLPYCNFADMDRNTTHKMSSYSTVNIVWIIEHLSDLSLSLLLTLLASVTFWIRKSSLLPDRWSSAPVISPTTGGHHLNLQTGGKADYPWYNSHALSKYLFRDSMKYYVFTVSKPNPRLCT